MEQTNTSIQSLY